MFKRIVFIVWLVLMSSDLAFAQRTGEELPLYHTVRSHTMMYRKADSTQPYVDLRFHEPVYLLQMGLRWSEVRTRDGAQGFVPNFALSNAWIRISKGKQTLYAYRGEKLVKEIPVDLGHNAFADKVRQGSRRSKDDWRTPEGVFFIANKNPRSTFYKAFVLNYPTAEDGKRGLQQGLITKAQYASIVRAEEESVMPPMNTALGGWIEIHGKGTGARSNWTQGCVAVRDAHIDELWNWIPVGTPVLIEQ